MYHMHESLEGFLCIFDSTNGMNSKHYRFIPLQLLNRFSDGANQGLTMEYLGMHQLLCGSDTQLSIPTDLNIPLWESLYNGHRDHQLIFLGKYGFPQVLSQSLVYVPQTVITNHCSAIQHPGCILN